MKIFYTTFICIFFNVYITKAAKQEPFTIDIYLPIFSCLDEFVAGNLWVHPEISIPGIVEGETHLRVLCNLGWKFTL